MQMEEENCRILEFSRIQQEREEERMKLTKAFEESKAAVQNKVISIYHQYLYSTYNMYTCTCTDSTDTCTRVCTHTCTKHLIMYCTLPTVHAINYCTVHVHYHQCTLCTCTCTCTCIQNITKKSIIHYIHYIFIIYMYIYIVHVYICTMYNVHVSESTGMAWKKNTFLFLYTHSCSYLVFL